MKTKTPRYGGASEIHNQSTAHLSGIGGGETLAASAHVFDDANRDPSRLAYEQTLSVDADETRRAILELLAEHGALVDDDLYRFYLAAGYEPRSPQRIRTVRSELVRAGKVRRVGRGLSRHGNPSSRWEVAV